MPQIVSDIADAYVYRVIHARPQFLMLRRRVEGVSAATWQAIHTRIEPGETAVAAAVRETQASTNLTPAGIYSADYVSQIYDHRNDTIVLSPAFAIEVSPHARVELAPAYADHAWCDLEETTARLAWSAQRWAVRHIYDVIAIGGEEADLYRIG